MFRDSVLVPAEALRLAALGMLAEGPRRYGDLAAEIRLFASRIAGPALELMGTSVELLRYERLVEAVPGDPPEEGDENPVLAITTAGRSTLEVLLQAPLKTPGSQFNRLFLALKLRFLHLLPPARRRAQIGFIADWYKSERDRLNELFGHPSADSALFATWVEQEKAHLERHIAWLAAAAQAVGET